MYCCFSKHPRPLALSSSGQILLWTGYHAGSLYRQLCVSRVLVAGKNHSKNGMAGSHQQRWHDRTGLVFLPQQDSLRQHPSQSCYGDNSPLISIYATHFFSQPIQLEI
jgi:hypothetical protein